MIAQGLMDAFQNLPAREGQGWMQSEEAPQGSGEGRFLDFYRLRATDMEGECSSVQQHVLYFVKTHA